MVHSLLLPPCPVLPQLPTGASPTPTSTQDPGWGSEPPHISTWAVSGTGPSPIYPPPPPGPPSVQLPSVLVLSLDPTTFFLIFETRFILRPVESTLESLGCVHFQSLACAGYPRTLHCPCSPTRRVGASLEHEIDCCLWGPQPFPHVRLPHPGSRASRRGLAASLCSLPQHVPRLRHPGPGFALPRGWAVFLLCTGCPLSPGAWVALPTHPQDFAYNPHHLAPSPVACASWQVTACETQCSCFAVGSVRVERWLLAA